VPCNPFDVAGLAATIERALELDEADRRRRIERMAATVARRDVYWWTEQELAAAGEGRTAASPPDGYDLVSRSSPVRVRAR
jgi:trehalose-6-phosphate synthase